MMMIIMMMMMMVMMMMMMISTIKYSSFIIKNEWCNDAWQRYGSKLLRDRRGRSRSWWTGEVKPELKWWIFWLRCLLFVCVGKRCITASQFVGIWLHSRGGWFMFDHDFGWFWYNTGIFWQTVSFPFPVLAPPKCDPHRMTVQTYLDRIGKPHSSLGPSLLLSHCEPSFLPVLFKYPLVN